MCCQRRLPWLTPLVSCLFGQHLQDGGIEVWLITSFAAAVSVTAAWIFAHKKYRLGFLALMLWGLSVMVLVDHVMGYEGGAFVEMETSGLIENGIVLGIAMLIPVFVIWEIPLAISKVKGEIAR